MLLLLTLVASLAIGLVWSKGIDDTKDWDETVDYESWFGDQDNE